MPISATLLLCRPIVRTQVGIWNREGQKRFLLDFLTGPPPPPPPVFEWVVGFLRWRSYCHCERTCLFHERRCLALLKGGRQIALDNGWWWRRRQEVSPIFTPFPAPATSARVPYTLARKKKNYYFFLKIRTLLAAVVREKMKNVVTSFTKGKKCNERFGKEERKEAQTRRPSGN